MTPEQWKRARLVLEGARRHSLEDRSQYISIACADDPELQREVESLLNLSSTPPPDVTDRSGPALTHWEHLTVLAEVGRGAFGRVYRAWDPALQMEVALKLIRVDTREAEFADSVFHEARLLVKVRHPNVVTVLGARRVGPDVGIWMEFVNGPTLADAVERDGPMSAVEAATAGIAICDALAAVHGAGLLHRDIKARNVMRDASGRIVLMDFGAGADRRYLPSGELAGTPLYMAPEVLKGAGASVASDIYSVGVLLFHLVTGEYPVSGNTIYELEAAHESGERVRLADRRADLHASFLAAVERALSPDPAARFRRAVEFRDALSDATTRITVPVAAATPAALLDRWPWMLGVGLGAAFLIVTFLGFVASVGFNLTLGRTGRFLTESAVEWPIWGIRALIAPVIYMSVMFLLGMLVRSIGVGLATAVRRLGGRGVRPAASVFTAHWQTRPNGVLRLAALVGTVALIVIWWQFRDLIEALTVRVIEAEPGALAPLAPDNAVERVLYRRSLELTMLVIGFGAYSAFRSARRSMTRLDSASLVWAAGVFVIALLMTVIPYRITLHNEFVRVRFDGSRCYELAQVGRDVLLYCPERVPRKLEASIDDRRLRDEGFYESIFIPPEQAVPPSPVR